MVTFEGFLEALRGGEFRQVFGALRIDDCHCPNGVLCELIRRDDPLKYRWVPLGNPYEYLPAIDTENDRIVYAFEHGKPGDEDYFFIWDYPHGRNNFWAISPALVDAEMIVQLNDDQKWSFTQIADWLEEKDRNIKAMEERIAEDRANTPRWQG